MSRGSQLDTGCSILDTGCWKLQTANWKLQTTKWVAFVIFGPVNTQTTCKNNGNR